MSGCHKSPEMKDTSSVLSPRITTSPARSPTCLGHGSTLSLTSASPPAACSASLAAPRGSGLKVTGDVSVKMGSSKGHVSGCLCVQCGCR